jgi:hypothetical protein
MHRLKILVRITHTFGNLKNQSAYFPSRGGTRMKYTLAFILIAMLLVACGGEKTTTDQDSPDTVADDSGAQQAAVEQPKQCKQAIDYKVLVGALPTEATGFTATSEPEGSTASYQDPTNMQNTWTYSTASVILSKSADENGVADTIDLSVIDTCYISYLSAGWMGYAQYEGTQGYLKKTTIKGFPGWKQYDKSSNSYSVHILVKDRVFVSSQGSEGVSEGNVESAANAIDYDKIASAANS